MHAPISKWLQWILSLAVLLLFAVGVVLLMLWLAGKFSPKVPEKESASTSRATAEEKNRAAPVRLVRMPIFEMAVGTVRAVHETTIGSKILARVVQVNLKAGEAVREGDVLVRLDDTDLKAKLQQARAEVASAEAHRSQAASDERRYANLVKTKTVSQQDYDKAVADLKKAEADLLRAQAGVNGVQSDLDCATIRAPFDSVVIDKKVDTGDMVTPGQPLVTLFDPKRMQLVASVRESLTHKLKPGQKIGVRIEALDLKCHGTISEIVPEAQMASRSFQVKVTGPCPPGVVSGMSGHVLVPMEDENVLLIPRNAVRGVGQLQLVEVLQNDQITRRSIRTGRTFDENPEDIEVLSGLREGEEIVLPAASDRQATQ